jgi:hypothetical protein
MREIYIAPELCKLNRYINAPLIGGYGWNPDKDGNTRLRLKIR